MALQQTRMPHRQRLLRSGDRLFYERGYHGTSVDAVLADAEAPKGSFYHHFGSKETFGAAVLDRYADSRLRLLSKWMARTDLDVVERVTGYHRDLVERVARAHWERGCLAGKLTNEMAWSSEPFRTQLAAIFATSRDLLSADLEAGQDRGEVSSTLPAVVLADAVQATVQGGLVTALVLRDRSILDQQSAALEALLRGDGAAGKTAPGAKTTKLAAQRSVAATPAGDDAAGNGSAGDGAVEAPSRRPDSHRETLLREGLRQIFQHGCHGTTVDRLLQASGVPKGSFYHHFRSRGAFFSAVLDRYGTFHRTRLDDWRRRADLPTDQQVTSYYRDLAGIFVRSGFLNSDLSSKIASELAVTSDPLREQVGGNVRTFHELLEQLLADGQRAGHVRADQDARQIAVTVHALTVGSFLLAQAHRDEQTLEATADVLTAVIAGR